MKAVESVKTYTYCALCSVTSRLMARMGKGPWAIGIKAVKALGVVCKDCNVPVVDVSERLESYVWNRSARIFNTDFETEGSARSCVAVRGMVKTRSLRALMDSLPMSTSKSSECRYCKN